MKVNDAIKWIHQAYLGFLDFVYPIGCLQCNEVGNGYLCPRCERNIIFIEKPFCAHCGIPLDSDKKNYCSRCSLEFGYHDGGFSVAIYEKPISLLIQELKYKFEKGIADFLADLVIKRLKSTDQISDLKCDIFHPIPLFIKKQRYRGFNQSALIAQRIAPFLNLNFDDSILERTRDTPSQTGLHFDERIINIRDAFQVKDGKDVEGKSIILFDDVITTGATIQECARTLKEAGASKVKFLTIARRLLD